MISISGIQVQVDTLKLFLKYLCNILSLLLHFTSCYLPYITVLPITSIKVHFLNSGLQALFSNSSILTRIVFMTICLYLSFGAYPSHHSQNGCYQTIKCQKMLVRLWGRRYLYSLMLLNKISKRADWYCCFGK